MSALRFAPLAALLLLAAACGDEATGVPETTEFASELGVDLAAMERRESGLYVQDLKVGEGVPAESGNYPEVFYTLWLPDGQLVESNEGARRLYEQLGYHVRKRRRSLLGWLPWGSSPRLLLEKHL